jgi:hypothetical protein
MSDLRERIATIVHDKDTLKCCDECTISSPGPWAYEVADAIIEALKTDYVIVDTRGCQDPWHQAKGAPFQCPTCGQWMGEPHAKLPPPRLVADRDCTPLEWPDDWKAADE